MEAREYPDRFDGAAILTSKPFVGGPDRGISLNIGQDDHRVHRRKTGQWVCRLTAKFDKSTNRWVKSTAKEGGKLTSWYFKTELQAYAKLIELDPSAGRWVTNDVEMTVGEWLEQWLADGRKASGGRWRPKTVEFNSYLVSHYSLPLHNILLADLTEADVRTWVEALATKRGAALRPTARHDVMITLNAALNAAVRKGKLERNPVAGVHFTEPSPPKRLQENVTWSRAEVGAFIKGIKGDRFEALYLVALGLGLRQGETLGLTWNDVDLEAERLHVRHQLQRNGRWQLVAPKTKNSLRAVVLSDNPALAALRAHKKGWKRGVEPGLENLVFLTAAGGPIDAHNLAKVFKTTVYRLGLPPIVFHELRAIFTTRNLDAGVPSNQVADMIGDSLAMVETYRRRHIENQRAAHKAVWG